jgi:hypothetical protein
MTSLPRADQLLFWPRTPEIMTKARRDFQCGCVTIFPVMGSISADDWHTIADELSAVASDALCLIAFDTHDAAVSGVDRFIRAIQKHMPDIYAFAFNAHGGAVLSAWKCAAFFADPCGTIHVPAEWLTLWPLAARAMKTRSRLPTWPVLGEQAEAAGIADQSVTLQTLLENAK